MRNNYKKENFILNIKCAEDHLVIMSDAYGRGPLKNCVLEMIKRDLGLDTYYIHALRTILVKVDYATVKIPDFKTI